MPVTQCEGTSHPYIRKKNDILTVSTSPYHHMLKHDTSMIQKNFHPKQPYKRDHARRKRHSVHKSKLPYWLARQPLVQRFTRMSRKKKLMFVGWSATAFLVVVGLFTTVYFANSLGSKDR